MPLFSIDPEDMHQPERRAHALDVQKLVVKNEIATFFVRAGDNTYASWGIFKGDVVVVDRSMLPQGKIVVVVEGAEFVLKKCLLGEKGLVYIAIDEEKEGIKKRKKATECTLWGAVTYTIHKVDV